ncbi:MAG: diguanylate cyclase [Sulfuricellaceae bacterium]|nr:diguanylate cyclase [Sulfuricellaceae bacterium]
MKLDTKNPEGMSLRHTKPLRAFLGWKPLAVYILAMLLPLGGIAFLSESELILGLAGAALVFAAAAAYIAQRHIFAPLQTLQESMAAFAEGDRQTRVHFKTPNALAALAEGFNRMADSLGKLDRLEQISITDNLTGLANRRYFDERLEVEFSRAFRHEFDLSLLILDIDHFEQIDDEYGRSVGEHVLLAVAQATKNSTRNTDLCARYDGEEFVVMLPFTNREQAAIVAEKIRSAVAATPVAGMKNGNPSVSIGVACYPDSNALSLEEMWARTDQALNSAKESGRNRVALA